MTCIAPVPKVLLPVTYMPPSQQFQRKRKKTMAFDDILPKPHTRQVEKQTPPIKDFCRGCGSTKIDFYDLSEDGMSGKYRCHKCGRDTMFVKKQTKTKWYERGKGNSKPQAKLKFCYVDTLKEKAVDPLQIMFG